MVLGMLDCALAMEALLPAAENMKTSGIVRFCGFGHICSHACGGQRTLVSSLWSIPPCLNFFICFYDENSPFILLIYYNRIQRQKDKNVCIYINLYILTF